MKIIRITVEQIVEVPDDENLTALAMALQDSSVLLFEQLSTGGNYEVIVYSLPPPREKLI